MIKQITYRNISENDFTIQVQGDKESIVQLWLALELRENKYVINDTVNII